MHLAKLHLLVRHEGPCYIFLRTAKETNRKQRNEKNEHLRDLVCSMASEMLVRSLIAILLLLPHAGG